MIQSVNSENADAAPAQSQAMQSTSSPSGKLVKKQENANQSRHFRDFFENNLVSAPIDSKIVSSKKERSIIQRNLPKIIQN